MTGEEYLAHHGIKGMKWGVRRTPEQLGHHISIKRKKSSAPKKTTTKVFRPKTEAQKEKERKEKVKTMTDQELRERINRIQLEQNYLKLTKPPMSRGEKFVQSLGKTTGEVLGKAVKDAMQDAASKQAKRIVNQLVDDLIWSGKDEKKK